MQEKIKERLPRHSLFILAANENDDENEDKVEDEKKLEKASLARASTFPHLLLSSLN